MTQVPGDKTRDIVLRPGQRRAANGVIIGSGEEPAIPRFGADETDDGYQPVDQGAESWSAHRDFFFSLAVGES